MSNILDGKALAATIRKEVAVEVKSMVESGISQPGLAVIIVGNDKASHLYVNSKIKACAAVGIYSETVKLKDNISQQELCDVIKSLNINNKIHGILLQLPIPDHLDSHAALEAINPRKDVDGFHPMNVGYLNIDIDTLAPCTPLGIMELLKRNNIQIEGKNAVVVGRSNFVGKPMAAMLTRSNATVTLAHSRTQNLPELIKTADILVAAVGKPKFIKGEWIKEGAVVIDVGINSIEAPDRPRGFRVVGDVDYAVASQKAGKITPVPGGVGPMTIAMLLANTVKAKKKYFLK